MKEKRSGVEGREGEKEEDEEEMYPVRKWQ